MSKDLNKVMLTGYLGADPEMRFTPQGRAVTTFRVASGRSWKSADGAQHDDTEWFAIVAWDRLAELCNQYLVKGTRVYMEGRLQTRSWEDQESGQKRYKTEVIATDMIILSSRSDAHAASPGADAEEVAPRPAARSADQSNGQQAPPAPATRGAASVPPPAARARNVPQPILSDEDLPF